MSPTKQIFLGLNPEKFLLLKESSFSEGERSSVGAKFSGFNPLLKNIVTGNQSYKGNTNNRCLVVQTIMYIQSHKSEI